MLRSEIESLRSARVDFWFGKTVNFERMVTELESLEQGFAIILIFYVRE